MRKFAKLSDQQKIPTDTNNCENDSDANKNAQMSLWFLERRIAGIFARTVSQSRILQLGVPTTDLFSGNRLNSNEVSVGNVGLFV